MQHNTKLCLTGTRATRSPTVDPYAALSMYTNLATNKSKLNKCTHADDAVCGVDINPDTNVTYLSNVPCPGVLSASRTAWNTSALVNDATAAHA